MRTLFLVALYKRPDITRICFEGLLRLVEGTDHEIFCVVSEKTSEDLCRKYGFDYEWVDNDPVGRKLNLGLEKAMLFKRFDRLVQVGSDDLLSKEIFHMHDEGINGTRKSIMVNSENKSVKAVDRGQLLGSGRMIPRWVLDQMWCKLVGITESVAGKNMLREGEVHWLPVWKANEMKATGRGEVMSDERLVVWPNDRNSALDNASGQRINDWCEYPFTEAWKEVLVAIKSGQNIWTFDKQPGKISSLPEWVSDKERDMILSL